MMKLAASLGIALLLAGCSGMSYAISTYSKIDVKTVKMADDEYRIFDRPDLGKMMVTSSIGAAMGQGVGKGLLLMTVDTTPPKPMFQAAARQWLDETGRTNCKITDGYLIISPQFEFTYECPSTSGKKSAKRAP